MSGTPPCLDQIIGQARSWTSRFGEEAEGDRQETCFCPHFSSRLRFDKAAAPLSWEMPTNHWVSAPKNSRPALHHVYKHKNTPTKKYELATTQILNKENTKQGSFYGGLHLNVCSFRRTRIAACLRSLISFFLAKNWKTKAQVI